VAVEQVMLQELMVAPEREQEAMSAVQAALMQALKLAVAAEHQRYMGLVGPEGQEEQPDLLRVPPPMAQEEAAQVEQQRVRKDVAAAERQDTF